MSFSEFVVADDENGVEPMHSWDMLESWNDDESPEFLQNLAQDIQRRHAATSIPSSSPHNFDDQLASKINTEEDRIWRIRVKVREPTFRL